MLPTSLMGGFMLRLNAQTLEPNIHASNLKSLPNWILSEKTQLFSSQIFSSLKYRYLEKVLYRVIMKTDQDTKIQNVIS